MKKKLALLLASAMALTPLSALNVSVSAAEVTKIYADVYGIEVEFSDVPRAVDIEALTLTKIDGEEDVSVDWTESNISGTKGTIVPEVGTLEVDEPYRLSFGTTEEEFMIKTIFFENFDDTSVFATQDISDTTPFEYTNDYGDIEISYGTKGAFVKDSKVWVTDGALKISGLDTFLDLTNTTLMADVEGYANYYNGGGFLGWTRRLDNVHVHMLSRAQDSNASAIGIKLSNGSFTAVKSDENGAITNAGTAENYPENADFTFGMIAKQSASKTDIVSTATDITGEESAVSSERAVALRTNKKSITAFVDGGVLPYSDNAVPETAGDYVLGATYMGRGIATFDNVRITAYTDDFEEITGDLDVVSFENDNYEKLVLTFNNRLRDLGPKVLENLQILKDGVDITSTTDITIDPQDDTKINIVPDGYNAGFTYSVVIPEGFGKGGLVTTEEITEDVEVTATLLEVGGFEFKPEGIEITFKDKVTGEEVDLTDITDDADLASVVVEIDDQNNGTFVVDAGATVTKDGTKLMVVPSTYAVNKTYKVTIPQGFGNNVTYLENEYSHSQKFERIPVEIEEIYGNEGRIDIKFTSPIDKNDPTLNTSGITVYEITKDATTGNDITSATPEATTSSVTAAGELHIEFTGMTLDKTYELYVPKTFGTDSVGLTQDIRKKFTLTTIAFENFDNDGSAFGGIATGLIKGSDSAINGGDNCGFVYGNYYNLISSNEIAQTENYTMEFDYGIYYGVAYKDKTYLNLYDIQNNTDSKNRSGQKLLFNKQGAPQSVWVSSEENYIALTLRENRSDMTQRNKEDSSGRNQSTKMYDSHVYNGDAVKKDDGTFHIYNYGEEFVGIQAGKELKTVSGQIVSASERTPSKARKIKIIKTGSHFKVYRENDNGTMQLLHDFQPNKMTKKTGHIEVGGDGVEVLSFDNIRFTTVKFEDADVVATDLSVTSNSGGNISGNFTIKNFADEQKDVRAIVAAYDANGSMLCAYLDANTYIGAGEGLENLTFDLANSTNATSIKLFLWEDTTNRAQIGVYDIPLA